MYSKYFINDLFISNNGIICSEIKRDVKVPYISPQGNILWYSCGKIFIGGGNNNVMVEYTRNGQIYHAEVVTLQEICAIFTNEPYQLTPNMFHTKIINTCIECVPIYKIIDATSDEEKAIIDTMKEYRQRQDQFNTLLNKTLNKLFYY